MKAWERETETEKMKQARDVTRKKDKVTEKERES